MAPVNDVDPVLVPSTWYSRIATYQTVCGDDLMNLYGFRPVVLRGALHCRVHKRGGYRYYATELLKRYIRRRGVTEKDSNRWASWVFRELGAHLRTRQWRRRQKIALLDIQNMVGPCSAVVNGDQVFYKSVAAARSVARLGDAYRCLFGGLALTDKRRGAAS